MFLEQACSENFEFAMNISQLFPPGLSSAQCAVLVPLANKLQLKMTAKVSPPSFLDILAEQAAEKHRVEEMPEEEMDPDLLLGMNTRFF